MDDKRGEWVQFWESLNFEISGGIASLEVGQARAPPPAERKRKCKLEAGTSGSSATASKAKPTPAPAPAPAPGPTDEQNANFLKECTQRSSVDCIEALTITGGDVGDAFDLLVSPEVDAAATVSQSNSACQSNSAAPDMESVAEVTVASGAVDVAKATVPLCEREWADAPDAAKCTSKSVSSAEAATGASVAAVATEATDAANDLAATAASTAAAVGLASKQELPPSLMLCLHCPGQGLAHLQAVSGRLPADGWHLVPDAEVARGYRVLCFRCNLDFFLTLDGALAQAGPGGAPCEDAQ